jgi:hypothetical protein
MACPYLTFQWIIQGEIAGFLIFHSFLRRGLHYVARLAG